eukprot:5757646-Pleurochrysis_carterae.AAC.1
MPHRHCPAEMVVEIQALRWVQGRWRWGTCTPALRHPAKSSTPTPPVAWNAQQGRAMKASLANKQAWERERRMMQHPHL